MIPPQGLALGDLQITSLPVGAHTGGMDLVFSLAERWTEAGDPAGISGSVEFRTDVFDAASIEVLIERLLRVLVADHHRSWAAVVVGGPVGCR